jgi:hypothetical protein
VQQDQDWGKYQVYLTWPGFAVLHRIDKKWKHSAGQREEKKGKSFSYFKAWLIQNHSVWCPFGMTLLEVTYLQWVHIPIQSMNKVG